MSSVKYELYSYFHYIRKDAPIQFYIMRTCESKRERTKSESVAMKCFEDFHLYPSYGPMLNDSYLECSATTLEELKECVPVQWRI